MAITTATLADGSTLTTNTDDATGALIWTSLAPPPGSPGAVSAANQAALQAKAQAALTVNGNYLAIASPTVAQNTAQTQRLTRECSAVIRLLLGLLDDTAGT